MPVFSSRLIIRGFALAFVALAGGAQAASTGFSLTAYGVHVQRGSDLSITADELKVSPKGQISTTHADFSFLQGDNPVTGAVQGLSGRDDGDPWSFTGMQSYSKNTRIRFNNGRYDSVKAIIQGKDVAIADQGFSVTAPSGIFYLKDQSARLTGGIAGTVTP